MATVSLVLLLILHVHVVVNFVSTEETFGAGAFLPGRSLHSSGRVLPGASEGRHRSKRVASASIMTENEKTVILDKHNELRGQTNPPASNMKFLEWSDALATHAQQYSDMCIWGHGFPEENNTPYDPVGQNLWVAGPTTEDVRPVGWSSIQSWFNENSNYNLEDNSCIPGQLCGHYTQVVWAATSEVGCGMTFCPTAQNLDAINVWILNCHYGPAGNLADTKPYLPGPPCTYCVSGSGQCYNNQCRLCSTHSETCECRSVCKNCATLNPEECTCACPYGFTGPDCGRVCEDTNSHCGNGLPYSRCATDAFVREVCPYTCDICYGFTLPNFVCETTTSPPATDPPATNPPATDPPATDPPATDPPATDPPALPTSTVTSSCPSQVCINGGTLQLSECKCACTAEYQGKFCQHSRTQARRGVILVLIADIDDWLLIKDGLLVVVAKVVTTYCNDEDFQSCCPEKGTKQTTDQLAYVSAEHFPIATGYPEKNPDNGGSFSVMLLATKPTTSALCNGGSLSRKRRANDVMKKLEWPHEIQRRAVSEESFLDQGVLLQAITDGMMEISQGLTELNVSVTLDKVKAGEEEPLPPAVNGLVIAVIVVVSILALVTLAVIVFFVCKHISNKQKVRPPTNGEIANYSKANGEVTM